MVEKIGTFSPASDIILQAEQVTRLDEILSFAQNSARIVRLSFGVSAAYNLVGISIEQAERELIRNTLKMVNGNREQAAKILGIGERTLYRKIKEYGLTE